MAAQIIQLRDYQSPEERMYCLGRVMKNTIAETVEASKRVDGAVDAWADHHSHGDREPA